MNCNTPYISEPPYLPYRMNSISTNICTSPMSLRHMRISMALSHLSVCLCRHNLSSGMCILHWLHHGSGVRPSCRIVILEFQCLCHLYMKRSLGLPGLCALARHCSNSHATDVITCGKETTYVSDPPPPTSTPGSMPQISHEIYPCAGRATILPFLPCIPHNLP